MSVNGIVIMVMAGTLCQAESYERLTDQLKQATEPSEIHRLKSLVARSAVHRLESNQLSVEETDRLRSQIKAYCADLQLGSMDIWYGDAVVTWGRLLLLEEKWVEAREALMEQAEVLQNIEKNLAANDIAYSSISPLAGCRFVLGETYRLEYDTSRELEPAVEALKHYYNVYIKYVDSPWGEKARVHAEAMKLKLEQRGKKVRIDLGPHQNAFVMNQFKYGVRLVAQGRYDDAVNPIETALNAFPETRSSVEALRHLSVCRQELGHQEEVHLIAEYMCERFSADTNAPLAVLGMGRRAIDAGSEVLGEHILQLYLNAYAEHEKRSEVLSWFAWKAYEAEAWDKVPRLFRTLECELRNRGDSGERLEKVVYVLATHPPDVEALNAFMAEFPSSLRVAPALNKKAQALLAAGDFEGSFRTLEQLADDFPESAASRNALANLILSAVQVERFDVAGQILRRMLEDKEAYGVDVYLTTGEGLLKAQKYKLAEQAFGAVPLEEEQHVAERALYGMAASRFEQEAFESSLQTLNQLLSTFPASGRFYAVRLLQARCLVELGRRDEAIAAYGDAARNDHAVTVEMAGILINPEDKLAAYQRVALLADPNTLENRPLIAQSHLASLPLCMELQKYDLALLVCAQFEELFPEHEQRPAIEQFRKEAAHARSN